MVLSSRSNVRCKKVMQVLHLDESIHEVKIDVQQQYEFPTKETAHTQRQLPKSHDELGLLQKIDGQ